MFNFFHRRYPKDETALIFTIESGEVVSAIVKFEGEKKPNVFYTKREVITTDSNNNPEHLTPLMLHSLKKSTDDLVLNGLQSVIFDRKRIPIKKVYVFLGCPWYKSDTITKTIKKDNPFIISEDFLNEEADNFFKDLSIQGRHLDKKIISIKANGYGIDNPIGRKVKSVDLGAYVSVADNHILDEIQSVVQMSFPNFEISFHTISIALYSVMNKISEVKDYVLIVPEQSVCEFLLIFKGVFEASVSVPFGKHKIVDYIAKEHGTGKEEALSLLKSWKEGVLESEKSMTIETIIENAKNEWSIYVRGAMASLGRTALLPNTVFIAGKSLESTLLAEWLSVEEYTNQTFTLDKFKVLFFAQKDIHNLLEFKVPKEYAGVVISSCILFVRSL